jgi:hypothetical protein
LPTETIDSLRPPADPFPYFQHADRFRFEPEAREYSPVNAWWLADASLLVYGDAVFIERVFERSPLPGQGFSLDWLGTRERNRGIILTSDSAVVVVFRGTRVESYAIYGGDILRVNREDLWTDSQFFPTACQVGGRVHKGFLAAYRQIDQRVSNVAASRKPGQAVWLAGHSLGGALASLAAAHLGVETVHGLYTFGCPRVGNAAFVNKLPPGNHFRFVHRDDWAASVPPELLGYVHAGALRRVAGSRPRTILGDLASRADALAAALARMAKEFRFKVGEFPSALGSIADHAPVYYAVLLWNALLAAEGPREISKET